MKRTVTFSIIALTAVIVLVAGAVSWWRSSGSYHFAVVKEGVLYRSGCHDLRQLDSACRQGRIRTVVSLLDGKDTAKEPARSEPAYCREHDIRFECIPVEHWPTTADVRRFLEIVSDLQNLPVLVHCYHGNRRTGMMVAAYQRSVIGLSAAAAKAAMPRFDKAHPTLPQLEAFIDAYDPTNRIVDASALKPANNDEPTEEEE